MKQKRQTGIPGQREEINGVMGTWTRIGTGRGIWFRPDDWKLGVHMAGARNDSEEEVESMGGQQETVPCRFCGRPTTYTGTQECDPCHNVAGGLETFLQSEGGLKFTASSIVQALSSRGSNINGGQWLRMPADDDIDDCEGVTKCEMIAMLVDEIIEEGLG